jgi:hypothetical protein
MDAARVFPVPHRLRSIPSWLAGLVLVAGCSGGSPAPEVIGTPTPEPSVLQAGQTEVTLGSGNFYSPLDFVPPLALQIPAGWRSPHRGDDAFDLSRGDLRIVFDTPEGETVAPTLAQLRGKATQPTSVTGTLAGAPATGFDAVGGNGPWLQSPSGTVSVQLAARQRVRVLGADIDGVPLLAVITVSDQRQWSALLPEALSLLAGVTRG